MGPALRRRERAILLGGCRGLLCGRAGSHPGAPAGPARAEEENHPTMMIRASIQRHCYVADKEGRQVVHWFILCTLVPRHRERCLHYTRHGGSVYCHHQVGLGSNSRPKVGGLWNFSSSCYFPPWALSLPFFRLSV